jgi:hypothetical protein
MRMSFVRCQSCGSKALMAASQCPRCGEPLQLRDDYGKSLPLSRCRACDTYYPSAAGGCRWCGTTTPRSRGPLVAAVFVAVVVMGGAAWGTMRYLDGREVASPTLAATARVAEQAPARAMSALAASPAPASSPGAASPVPASSVAAQPVLPPTDAPPTVVPAASVAPAPPAAPPPPGRQAPDSSQWVGAVSTTWVNVRGHPSRDSAVIGVLKPESRVQLAHSRSAWTRVSAPGASGWVDRRLFAVDSARTPE